MRSYYTLSDYPHETVEIERAKCGRHGRLRTGRLLAGGRSRDAELGQHERWLSGSIFALGSAGLEQGFKSTRA
jgi:hypothetical protein